MARDWRDTFEYSEWIIASGSARLCLVVIYRPPYSSSHPRTVRMFVTELAEFLESVVMTAEPLVLAGEINIHVNRELKIATFSGRR